MKSLLSILHLDFLIKIIVLVEFLQNTFTLYKNLLFSENSFKFKSSKIFLKAVRLNAHILHFYMVRIEADRGALYNNANSPKV